MTKTHFSLLNKTSNNNTKFRSCNNNSMFSIRVHNITNKHVQQIDKTLLQNLYCYTVIHIVLSDTSGLLALLVCDSLSVYLPQKCCVCCLLLLTENEKWSDFKKY